MARELPIFGALGHSLSSTFNNLPFAMRVSWPWLLILLPVTIATNLYLLAHPVNPINPWRADTILISLGHSLLTMWIFASFAVNWHRYILLDEIPQGWGKLRGDNHVMRYFGNSILIVILGFLLGIVTFIPLGIFAGLLKWLLGGFGMVIVSLLMIAAAIWLLGTVLRWSIKLVAVALGKSGFTISDAWAYTNENHLRIVGLYILVFLASAVALSVLGVLVYFLAQAENSIATSVSIAIQVMLNWLTTIWGVTLLTSLFGFFVEERNF